MKLFTKEVASFLNSDFLGENIEIYGVCSLDKPKPNHLIFIKDFNENVEKKIGKVRKLIILCSEYIEVNDGCSIIIVKNPRLNFSEILEEYFTEKISPEISTNTKISNHAKIGKGCSINDFTTIEENVVIGDDCIIGNGVVIKRGTVIGSNVIIRNNSVIGEEGFGFEKTEIGIPKRIPHLGNVEIGNNVEIGSLNTICRGTIDNTVIMSNVKFSDHVHIAHNVIIRENSMLAGGVVVNGSASIGKNVWIGPNSSVMNGIIIEDDVVIGLGSVVVRGVGKAAVIAGNPAKKMNVREL